MARSSCACNILKGTCTSFCFAKHPSSIRIQTDDAMTLHWWMHWFWVTAQFLVISGNPVPSSTSEPQNQVQGRSVLKATTDIPSATADTVYATSSSRQNLRVAKAIGIYPQTNTAVFRDTHPTTVSSLLMERTMTPETISVSSSSSSSSSGSIRRLDNFHENVNTTGSSSSKFFAAQRAVNATDRMRSSANKKESKITWILTSNKTGRSKYDQEDKSQEPLNLGRINDTDTQDVEDLTVLPLQEEIPRVKFVLNGTKSLSPLSSSSSLSSLPGTGVTVLETFNRSDDDVEVDEDFEPQSFATAASILEIGASESTRLSRARSAFPKNFQRDQVQGDDHLADYNESSHGEESRLGGSSRSAVDIAAITGSCLATVVLLSTMGSLGFIMYRRRYLNPPQTLNSDKCSNPDSSGYIDDSTIRDNSEEMYSLDNDSFLNSLEAMTIQNYWTDTVKHTKL